MQLLCRNACGRPSPPRRDGRCDCHPWASPLSPATMLYAQTPTHQPKFALGNKRGWATHFTMSSVPQGRAVAIVSPLARFFFSFIPVCAHYHRGRKEKPGLRLDACYHLDGDAVAITASWFSRSLTTIPVRTNEGDHPKRTFGTFSLHPNESIVVARYGAIRFCQPWTIKLASPALPTQPVPPTSTSSLHPIQILGPLNRQAKHRSHNL